MSESIRTIVKEDPVDLARSIAERIRDLSRQAGDDPVAIALSGGSTPKLLFEVMAQDEFRSEIVWSRLVFFFGDERSVPPDHKDSNYRMAHEALLSKVDVEVHRMLVLEKDADSYEQILTDRITRRHAGIPIFDLVLLGMGPDGHTASLFPGTKALAEKNRLVVMNEVPQHETWRMTFTYSLINAAERVWVLMCGKGKHTMLNNCLRAREEGDKAKELEWPILGVRPGPGELIWWIDRAAAEG